MSAQPGPSSFVPQGELLSGGPIEAPKSEVVAVRNNAEQDVYNRMEYPRITDLWAGLVDAGLSFTRGNSDSTSFALTGKAARVTKRTKVSLYSAEIYARSTLAGVSNTTASAIRAVRAST